MRGRTFRRMLSQLISTPCAYLRNSALLSALPCVARYFCRYASTVSMCVLKFTASSSALASVRVQRQMRVPLPLVEAHVEFDGAVVEAALEQHLLGLAHAALAEEQLCVTRLGEGQ